MGKGIPAELSKTLNKQNLTIMKKTIMILLAMASAVTASESDLLWTVDFTGGSYAITTGSAWTGDAYNPGTGWGSQDFDTTPGALTSDGDKKIALEGSSPGVSLSSEFTLTMNVNLTGTGGNDTSDTSYWLVSLHQTQTSWFIGAQYDTTTQQVVVGNANHTLTNVVSYGTYALSDIKTITLTMAGAQDALGLFTIYVNDTKAAEANVAAGDRHDHSAFSNGVAFLNKMGEHDGVAGSITSASLYKGVLIPEPTTATLSLLALAGLAARRRRASR